MRVVPSDRLRGRLHRQGRADRRLQHDQRWVLEPGGGTASAAIPIAACRSTRLGAGVGRTYRYLDEKKSPPLYRFGYGLSYSSFEYTNLSVSTFDRPRVTVSVTLQNTGGVGAHEVAQLYVSVPGAGQTAPALPIPIRSLQGFTRRFLAKGAAVRLDFVLTPQQLSTVGADGSRTVTGGLYTVSVGGRQPVETPGLAVSGNFVEGTFKVMSDGT